jgi:hypothetical protein
MSVGIASFDMNRPNPCHLVLVAHDFVNTTSSDGGVGPVVPFQEEPERMECSNDEINTVGHQLVLE